MNYILIAQFYCDHDAFKETNRINSDLTLETLFSVALTDKAMNKFSETGARLRQSRLKHLLLVPGMSGLLLYICWGLPLSFHNQYIQCILT